MMRILVREGQRWETVEPLIFEDEAQLQALLKESPEIIPSDPLGEAQATVWCREFPTEAGPIDLLGIGSDGSITIMECKLARNQEIRRKVVGQILDYASALWRTDVAVLVDQFRRLEGSDPFDLLAARMDGSAWEVETARAEVANNLNAGAIRLLVAADDLDVGLRRIVSYVNSRAGYSLKLVVLTFQRYAQGSMEVLVPDAFGDESPAPISAPPRPTEIWDIERFVASTDEQTGSIARDLHAWIPAVGARVVFGKGAKLGTMAAHVDANGTFNPLFSIWTSGAFEVRLSDLRRRTPFDQPALRRELLVRLKRIPGATYADDEADRAPSRPVSLLATPEGSRAFKEAWVWAIDALRRSEAS